MSPKAPRLTAFKMRKAIEKAGFYFDRQTGSHMIFKHADGRWLTLPFHSRKILHPKLVAAVLKDAGLSYDDLRNLLSE